MTEHTHHDVCTNCTHAHSLDVAQDIARKSGHRWSETRTQVYHTLLMADKPVTAYELMDMVAKKYAREVKPASVYRSLDALMELGIVARIESANSFVACQNPECDHQHIFLVCDHCGQIDEISDHGINRQLLRQAAEQGFVARKQILELHGECKSCHVEG